MGQVSLTPFFPYNWRHVNVPEVVDGFSCASSGLRQGTSLLDTCFKPRSGERSTPALRVQLFPDRLPGSWLMVTFPASSGKVGENPFWPRSAPCRCSWDNVLSSCRFLLCSQPCTRDGSCRRRFYRRAEQCGRRTGTRCRSPEQRLPSCELHHIPSPPLRLLIRCTSLLLQSPFMLLSISRDQIWKGWEDFRSVLLPKF